MTVFAEWDTLKKVVMNKPGVELFLGHLELNSLLNERGFRI